MQRAIHSFVPQPARELIQGQKDVFEAFGAYVETDSESEESENNEGSFAVAGQPAIQSLPLTPELLNKPPEMI